MLDDVRDLIRRLIQWANQPARPGAMYVFCEELSMPNLFRVRVGLPPVTGPDVSKRTLLRTMNDDPTTSVSLNFPIDQAETSFKARQDDKVHLELRQVDDVGNLSEPSVLDFTVIDTTPPVAPDTMAVTLEELPDDASLEDAAPPAPETEIPPPVPEPVPEPTTEEPTP